MSGNLADRACAAGDGFRILVCGYPVCDNRVSMARARAVDWTSNIGAQARVGHRIEQPVDRSAIEASRHPGVRGKQLGERAPSTGRPGLHRR